MIGDWWFLQVENECTWDFHSLWKLCARISPPPAFSKSKGNLQRFASESYNRCSSKSEPALAGTVQTLAPSLDPAEVWTIYTWRLENPSQKRDSLQVLWTPETQTCFLLPSLPWLATLPFPSPVFTYTVNQMSQWAEQSCLGVLNGLAKFSKSNPALVWLLSRSWKSPLEPACV